MPPYERMAPAPFSPTTRYSAVWHNLPLVGLTHSNLFPLLGLKSWVSDERARLVRTSFFHHLLEVEAVDFPKLTVIPFRLCP